MITYRYRMSKLKDAEVGCGFRTRIAMIKTSENCMSCLKFLDSIFLLKENRKTKTNTAQRGIKLMLCKSTNNHSISLAYLVQTESLPTRSGLSNAFSLIIYRAIMPNKILCPTTIIQVNLSLRFSFNCFCCKSIMVNMSHQHTAAK